MIQNIKHKCFSVICVSSFENSLFRTVLHFQWLVFLLSSFWSFSYILDIRAQLTVWLVKVFSHCGACCFEWMMVSFAVQKLSTFLSPTFYCLNVCAAGALFRKSFPMPMSQAMSLLPLLSCSGYLMLPWILDLFGFLWRVISRNPFPFFCMYISSLTSTIQ